MFLADNLAAHTIGGLTESFSNVQKVSRYCHCSSADIQKSWDFQDCKLRTAGEFDQAVLELERSEFNRLQCLKEGIKSKCLLHAISGFHIINNTPPDIAHDLYEGLIPFVVSGVLTDLVKRKVLTLVEVNEALSTFPYSAGDRQNPPQPLSRSSGAIKCRQTAKEAFNLIRFLPLAVGYKVPKADPVWAIFLKFILES